MENFFLTIWGVEESVMSQSLVAFTLIEYVLLKWVVSV